MKSDESFERDVRASLLASATGPAPDDLAARIGEIPARQPLPTAGRGGLRLVSRVAVNLAAAAVVVIAVAALIVTRNGNLPPGGQATGSGSLPTASAPAATPVASASPSAASPVPSPTPGAPATALGLSPASATFVSATDGWVLGTGTCPSGPCAKVMRTTDGGSTWTAVPAPSASIVPGGGQGAPGISRLRFADARNGWAYGPDLWATHVPLTRRAPPTTVRSFSSSQPAAPDSTSCTAGTGPAPTATRTADRWNSSVPTGLDATR